MSHRGGAAVASASQELYQPPREREQLLRQIQSCDSAAEAARQAQQQQQVLERLEEGLHLRRKLYTEASPEVTVACRRLCEACNFTATLMLQSEKLQGAHDLLKRAEQVADKSDVDRAITWNNLACYYRRTGKLRAASTFLERALTIEERTGNSDAAQTHLNLCATLSQLRRHSDALHHAQCALIRIYEVLAPHMLSGELGAESAAQQDGRDERQEQVTVLCIAYHNLAVEQEYLKSHENALCAYAQGFYWARQYLSEGHQLIGILRDSMAAVRPKIPENSGALRRAAELMEAAEQMPRRPVGPQRAAGADGEVEAAAETAPNMRDLMTPRGGGAVAAQGAMGPGCDESEEGIASAGPA